MNTEQPLKTEENLMNGLKGENYGQMEELSPKTNIQGPSESNTSTIQKVIDGSENSFGKFKDAESLFKAYNSLQAEFTKKSQRLSELESENRVNQTRPLSRQEKIEKGIEELVQNYEEAKPFVEQIKANLSVQDADDYNTLAKKEFVKVLAGSVKTPNDMLNDQEFLTSFVYNNESIKEHIITDYLSKLKDTAPIKVSSNFTSNILMSPPNTCKTITEAGRVAKNIIKQI